MALDMALKVAQAAQFREHVRFYALKAAFAYLSEQPAASAEKLKFAKVVIGGALDLSGFALAVLATSAPVFGQIGDDPDGTLVQDAALRIAVNAIAANTGKAIATA
jgi:hypothetical protein